MMQKIRPDMDISKNIQSIRYANKLTQDQVIAKLNLMGISMSKSGNQPHEYQGIRACCPC